MSSTARRPRALGWRTLTCAALLVTLGSLPGTRGTERAGARETAGNPASAVTVGDGAGKGTTVRTAGAAWGTPSGMDGRQAVTGWQLWNSDLDRHDVALWFNRYDGPREPFSWSRRFYADEVYFWWPQSIHSGPAMTYAAWLASDAAMVGRTVTRWELPHAYYEYSQVASDLSAPSTEVVAPWVAKRFAGETSVIGIQNTDDGAAAIVTVSLYPATGGPPALEIVRTIAARAGTLVDLRSESDPQSAELPCGFAGWARIAATAPVAVTVLGDVTASRVGVYSYEGVPLARTAPRLDAPLVGTSGDDREGFHTRLVLANPDARATAVTVTYHGITGSCAGRTVVHGDRSHEVAAGAVAVFDQGPGSVRSTGASGLPQGCVATATVEATGIGVVGAVVVLDPAGSAMGASAYVARPPHAAVLRAAVPSFGLDLDNVGPPLATHVIVMNPGPGSATVALAPRGADGHGVPCRDSGCTVTIAPHEGASWFSPYVRSAEGDGPASVTSNRPVHVLVRDVAFRLSIGVMTMEFDPTASYALAPPPAGVRDEARHAPLSFYLVPSAPGAPCRSMLPLCSRAYAFPTSPRHQP